LLMADDTRVVGIAARYGCRCAAATGAAAAGISSLQSPSNS